MRCYLPQTGAVYLESTLKAEEGEGKEQASAITMNNKGDGTRTANFSGEDVIGRGNGHRK